MQRNPETDIKRRQQQQQQQQQQQNELNITVNMIMIMVAMAIVGSSSYKSCTLNCIAASAKTLARD
jgi:hypothetical protein